MLLDFLRQINSKLKNSKLFISGKNYQLKKVKNGAGQPKHAKGD
jgi:hypothetical protein